MKFNILIVEDDNEINNLLKKILQREGYGIYQAYSGTEALLYIRNNTPDLILLDRMLPGISGDEFLQILRDEQKYTMPVIVLSAKSSLKDKVALLGLGADDYVTKPFEPEEVVARVQAALRRGNLKSASDALDELSYKNIKLYPYLRKVKIFSEELLLTNREYEILYLLMSNPEKVYSRERLYELVWQEGYYGTDHTINVHISNLRNKIKEYDPLEEYIQSVYGVGFRLEKT